jgi:hypothetical protein
VKFNLPAWIKANKGAAAGIGAATAGGGYALYRKSHGGAGATPSTSTAANVDPSQPSVTGDAGQTAMLDQLGDDVGSLSSNATTQASALTALTNRDDHLSQRISGLASRDDRLTKRDNRLSARVAALRATVKKQTKPAKKAAAPKPTRKPVGRKISTKAPKVAPAKAPAALPQRPKPVTTPRKATDQPQPKPQHPTVFAQPVKKAPVKKAPVKKAAKKPAATKKR